MAKLRMALTISGAVSLGAFEAGVLAGLLSAIRPLCAGDDPAIRLDAIGGASAGSMAGLLAARCLTAGYDPVYVMEQAWVVQDSIKKMRAHNSQAPLSMDELRQLAADLLDLEGHDVESYQSVAVQMVMTLTCLRGLDYAIKGGGTAGQAIDAVTFLDLSQATIDHETSADDLLKPENASIVDVALASGANEVGFPPKLLDRSSLAGDYAQKGLALPPSKRPWYTDGGTLDNEPLGHTLDLTAALDAGADGGEFTRLHLLIHPNPAAAPSGDGWANPDVPPTWVETLIRGDHLQRTQSLYDDLREVVKTNTRIGWMDELVDTLGPVLDGLNEKDALAVQKALRETVEKVDADQSALPGHQKPAGAEEPAAAVAPTSAGEWLAAALQRVTGTTEKKAVDVDVISPLIIPGAMETGVDNMLAGDVLFHFGGFLDENMRKSDFHLGYSCTLQWLHDGGLQRHGVDDADAQTALAAAEAAFSPEPLWKQWGRTTAEKLAERHPLALAGLVGQIGRVVIHDGLHRHNQNS
jgi:predicted acylesterase/phospholipase RssA